MRIFDASAVDVFTFLPTHIRSTRSSLAGLWKKLKHSPDLT